MTKLKKNPLKLDAHRDHPSAPVGHFFVASAATWRAGLDVEKLCKAARAEGMAYLVWWVPVVETQDYDIVSFAPQVTGAHLIASYGFDHYATN
jgi:hypothetical protein